jgi:hypothetical protein
MASIALKINDIEQIIAKIKAKRLDTLIFSATGTVSANNSKGMSRIGVHIGELPFRLLDDPREETYWPEVRHKLVIAKSHVNGSIHMGKGNKRLR